MKANIAKMNILTRKTAPHDNAYVGWFYPRETFNKLIAYSREKNGETKFIWIHKDYQK